VICRLEGCDRIVHDSIDLRDEVEGESLVANGASPLKFLLSNVLWWIVRHFRAKSVFKITNSHKEHNESFFYNTIHFRMGRAHFIKKNIPGKVFISFWNRRALPQEVGSHSHRSVLTYLLLLSVFVFLFEQ